MPYIDIKRQTTVQVALLGLAVALGVLAGNSEKLALGAIAALVFVGLVWTNYTVAVGLFIVTTFISTLPGTVTKGIGGVLVLAWFAMLATRSEGGFTDFAQANRGMAVLVLAFLGWTTIGVAWAQSSHSVINSLGRYIPNLAVFFIVFAAAQKRRDAQVLFAFFVAGTAVAAADGVLNPPAAAAADVSRTGGTFGDPNYLAAVLVVGLGLGLAIMLLRSMPPVVRAGAAISCCLCISGILLSVSRGGLIALGVALVVSVLVARRYRLVLGLLTATVTLVVVGYFAFFASSAVRYRVTHANGGSGRADIWLVGWRMVQAHPVNGVGAGNFQVVSRQYLLRPGLTTRAQYIIFTPAPAHNTYLEVLAEEGAVGLALLVAIFAAVFRCTQKAWVGFRRSGDRQMELLSYAHFAGLAGFLVASFFLSEEYSKQLWLLLAFGPMLLHVSRLSPDAVGQKAVQSLRSVA